MPINLNVLHRKQQRLLAQGNIAQAKANRCFTQATTAGVQMGRMIQQQTGSRITRSTGVRTQKKTRGSGRGRWPRKGTGTSGATL